MENPNCENGPDHPDDSEVGPAATCSLVEAAVGKQMAVLPHFTPVPLPVEVDEWHRGGKLAEKTVRLLQGTLKGKFLADEQLEGAQFLGACSYPANASAQGRESGSQTQQGS